MQRLRLKLNFTTLLTLVAGLMLFASPLMAEDAPTLQMAQVNPAFTDFMLHRPLMQSVTSESKGFLGYIPSPLDRSHLKGGTTLFGVESATALPASYDLRTLDRVTPVRDQGNCGSCWSFGAIASLESSLLPTETWDLSENNLKNNHGFDWGPCDGGNVDISTAYLMRWGGPVNEADDPYHPDTTPSPTNLTVQKHQRDVIVIPLRTSTTDNNTIKSAIQTYGAITVSMYWSAGSYNAVTASYYYNGAITSSNHEIAIVGWDDDYAKDNFSPPAPANGAFIMKNSWGASWGQSGYFYISYYDTVLGYSGKSELAAFSTPDSATTYSRIYSYDPLGATTGLGYTANTGWFANIFTAQGNESIGAVSFYNATMNSPYEVYIYKDLTNLSDPGSGTQIASVTGTLSNAGYLTVPLTAPVPVTSGQKFSVVVKLTTPGYNYPIPIEYPISNYSTNVTASPGQSFISSAGTSWTDITTSYSTTNVCVKAYALSEAAAVYSMSGTVHVGSADGPVISGAQVSIADKSATTDTSGAFSITGIAAGTYTLIISATGSGYSNYTDNSYAVNSDQSGLNLFLTLAGSVIINKDSPYTKSRTVTLTLSSLAAKSMRFSNDGTNWGNWTPYAKSKAYTLPSGEGVKTVHAQFRDSRGSISPAFSDSITLDMTKPVGSITINGNATSTTDPAVTLTLVATDAGSNVVWMRFSRDNITWSAWEPYIVTRSMTFSKTLGKKTVYARFKDGAGNVSTTCSDSIRLVK